MTELRIATRNSPLAMIQARRVGGMLSEAHPGVEVEYVEITTTGDRDRISPVTTLTEVGAFVRAVQQAVVDGRADLAVHSCKDLPVEGPADLEVFYPERAAPWDVLCGYGLDALPGGARVGTGSPRRAVQLMGLRPDVEIAEIRGNVGTRLDKVESGEFDAVVLAEAGLSRLGLEDRIDHRFSIDQMVPAPAQAALAVESRVGSVASTMLGTLEDPDIRSAVESERMLLTLTGAGCRSALGALGSIVDGGVRIDGFVSDDSGERRGHAIGATPNEAARALRSELGL